MSQRRVALTLHTTRKTVERKFRFLAQWASLENERFLQKRIPTPHLLSIQFDDLESSIHTKCKPVSVALAVSAKSRLILGFRVSLMPAKGKLAKIARKRYGFRPDKRSQGLHALFSELTQRVSPNAHFLSDQNPLYPSVVRRHFPLARHDTVKGRRGCVVGQGELKKIGFDPLFSLNHTCAMYRANVNRFFRKTWCTSKTIEGLERHLSLYTYFHNRWLICAAEC